MKESRNAADVMERLRLEYEGRYNKTNVLKKNPQTWSTANKDRIPNSINSGEAMQPCQWANHIMNEVSRYLSRLGCPHGRDPSAFNANTQRALADVRHALMGFVTRHEELPGEPVEPNK